MNQEKKQGGHLHAIFVLIILLFSIVLFFIPILILGLLKLLPIPPLKKFCARNIDKFVTYWCDLNNHYITFTNLADFECTGVENIKRNDWHLVIANHQSWLDVIVLQRVLNRKIPVLKFFVKDQLKWIPFLGFAWWVMGCPFMKRYPKNYIEKYPHKKGKDLETTRKAVKSFKKTPASVASFVEGTRFTPTKKEEQESPHEHLLKPKAGGLGFILSAMGEHFDNLLDVTIVYPEHHSLWDFLCGRIDKIKVSIREIHIEESFKNPEMMNNKEIFEEFCAWLNTIWAEKNQIAKELKANG